MLGHGSHLKAFCLLVSPILLVACTDSRDDADGKPEELVLEDYHPTIPRYIGRGAGPNTKLNLDSYTNLEDPGSPRHSFQAPQGCVNLAEQKKVTCSQAELPWLGDLSLVTDGDSSGLNGSFVELEPGRQWVQIDLGSESEIYAVLVWHFHQQMVIYHDVIVQISSDERFEKDVITVFNNDHDGTSFLGKGDDPSYIETNIPRIIDVDALNGRYVRLYSNGNSESDLNHYVEVQVYGIQENQF